MSGSVASSEPDGEPRLTASYAGRAHAGRSRRGETEARDELLQPDRRPHSHAADLAATVDHLGLAGLLTRRAEVARLVEDEGVTYGATPSPEPVDEDEVATTTATRRARRWVLDPLPVIMDAAAWSGLETGLQQRAHLLDAVLADLYGPRTLLTRGVIPPEVVLGYPGFVRAADQIRLPGPQQLLLSATDLARDGDGAWRVIDDRAAAPSGAGYAIQARRIVGRVLPGLYRDTGLRRLRGFFDALRLGLQEVAPSTAEAPRVVLLIPGPSNRTPFDHAFLATLLGYPLVTAEDLTVREGRVHLRSLGRLEPVDVVLRRVGDDDADPLELRADSELGVPGLLEASRLGTVSVVNPIGAGVLESPALAAYLPAAARALLGEDLALAGAQSWWCGEESARAHVLANLDTLVLRPVDRTVRGAIPVHGSTLSRERLDQLRRRIEVEPQAWAAQQPVALSTTPIVTARGLQPRRFTVRAFAVGVGGDYRVLPGGLGRVAGEIGNHAASNGTQAPAKDVWVLTGPDAARGAPEPSGTGELAWPRGAAAIRAGTAAAAEVLPPRVAENLFRLGRFAERAEDAVRLLRVVDDLTEDWTARPGTPGASALAVLRRALPASAGTAGTAGTADRTGGDGTPASVGMLRLVTDPGVPDGLAASVRATVEAAEAVREQLSLDTWIVLGSLERVLAEAASAAASRAPGEVALQPVLARVLEGLLALAGLGAESMVRDLGWSFMDAGRRIERAAQLLTVLRRTLAADQPPPVRAMVLESVLVVGESIITHRRRHPNRPGAARVADVLDLLLLDRGNPRAVALQLDRLLEDLAALPDGDDALGRSPTDLHGRARAIVARLRELDPERLAAVVDGRRPVLVAELDALLADLADLAERIQDAHFGHVAPHRPMAAISGWNA